MAGHTCFGGSLTIYLLVSLLVSQLINSLPYSIKYGNLYNLAAANDLNRAKVDRYALKIKSSTQKVKETAISINILLGIRLLNITMAAYLVLLSGDVELNPGPFDLPSLRCLSFNAQSLKSFNKLADSTIDNLKSFQDLVYAENLDIITVTETWLNDQIEDDEILPFGYNIIRGDRLAGKRGGGVLIALRDNIPFTRLSSSNPDRNWSDRLEIVAVEIKSANSKKALVCVCYRPPQRGDFESWLELFTAFLETTQNYDLILISGDYNFPELTWNSTLVVDTAERSISSESAKFRELSFDFFLEQINMYPTRQNNILDLVFTRSPEAVTNMSCVQPNSMELFSDHKLLFYDFTLHVKLLGCDKRTVFDFGRADWQALWQSLRLIDLSPSDQSNEDLDADWNRWKDLFLGAAADQIPRKTFKRRNTPPWIDNEVKFLLNKKDTCRKKAYARIYDLCPKLWEKFRKLRREVKSLIYNKRKEFFQNLPDLLKTNSKKFWSAFKASSKHSNVPNKLVWTRDTSVMTANNPTDISNLLNCYFFSVFKSDTPHHAMPLPNSPDDDSSTEILSDVIITADEIYDALSMLDVNKATGPDKIPAKLLKNCASCISSSLSVLFNKSLSLSKLPNEWKLSNIIPIPKGGKTDQVTSYRPISLLSLVSKILERCVFNRLMVHVADRLHKLQFGFLKGRSTTSQLLHVLHDIGVMLDGRCQVDAVYLDFAKAFDKVSHNLLLVKLHRFGVRGNLLRWFRDYLSNRYQRVTVFGETSRSLPVLSGVPQGSILGPLLFLIYVNDLPDYVSSSSSIAMFADDTKCYRAVNSASDAAALQADTNSIENWCKEWYMDLNQSKCGILSITRNLQPVTYPYTLLGAPIKIVDYQKDLGIIVTKDLKWNRQVQEVSAKANKMLGFIRRSAYDITSQQVRKTLYLILVRSKFAYCSQVWAPQTIASIQSLERVQRRATKFILSLPFRTDISYSKRLCSLDMIPITYWHEYLDLVYLYKCVQNDSDGNIKIRVPVRVTRRSNDKAGFLLNEMRCNTVTLQNSFYIRASRTWNTLPVFIRNAKSLTIFKQNLRNYYIDFTKSVYDPDIPQTFKTVCIKCHLPRSLDSISTYVARL